MAAALSARRSLICWRKPPPAARPSHRPLTSRAAADETTEVQKMKRPSILVCRLLTFTLIFGLLFPAPAHQAFGQSRRGVRANQNEKGKGMRLELSEPLESGQSKPRPAPVQVTPLSAGEAAHVPSRLPAATTAFEAEQPFAFRDRSLPPTRAGKIINESFPASGLPDAPKENSSGPLAVVRFAPEGEVALAPHLSVTFSQPMAAVTSHAELAAQEIPVRLTPAPPGKWRWLGSKTLLFAPMGRFPMATDYAVEVAAGTKSAHGGALPAARRWTFSTPPPQVKTSHPTGDAEPAPRSSSSPSTSALTRRRSRPST
jgi:hypothetical protein